MQIPQIKGNPVSDTTEKPNAFRALLGKAITKKVKFMDTDVTIKKLSVAEVTDIQNKAKDLEKNESEGFNVLKAVIKASCPEAEALSDDDFNSFPLDELSKLSNAIMSYSGIGGDQGK